MKYLAPLLLSLSASAAFAKPIVVQSGQHEGFSRLVFSISDIQDWRLKQDGGGNYVLQVQDHKDGFDTRSVFSRIDKSRLKNLTPRRQEIKLDLACNCDVSAFRVNSNYVALDITDGGLEEAPDREKEFYLRLDAEETSKVRKFSYRPSAFAAAAAETNETESTSTTVDLPVTGLTPDQPSIQRELRRLGMPNLVGDNKPDVSTSNIALETIEAGLSEQISLAATQGLLTPKQGHPEPRPTASILSDEQSSTQALPKRSLENARIYGAVEGSENPFAHALDNITGTSCPNETDFAIQTWSDGQSFPRQIAMLRSKLYGEFDSLNETAILPLARVYLHFGFGAEALQILAMVEKPTTQHRAAEAIATYLEYGSEATNIHLAGHANCDGSAALWSALVAEDSELNGDAILRTLSELPLHLRELLAPELSAAFRKHGDIDLAEASLRTIQRATHKAAPATSVQVAEIALSKGESQHASDELSKVAKSNEVEAPLALARMIDLHVKNGMPISDDLAVLAAAYAMEHRQSEIGALATRAHILALAKSEQFAAAFQVMEKAASDYADGMAKTETDYFRLLAKHADTASFLRHSFSVDRETLVRLAPETILLLAERTQSEGFAQKASQYAAGLPQQFKPRRQALLRARAALEMENPGYALEQLEDYAGADVEKLRAEAMLQLKMFEQAASQYAALGLSEDVERAAWRAPDLGEAAVEGSEALQLARRVRDDETPTAERISLELAENLISDVDTLLTDLDAMLTSRDLKTRP